MNFLSFNCDALLIYCSAQAQSAGLPHVGGADVHFSGMRDCFIQVVKNQGVLSLWNGLTANTIKVQFHLYVHMWRVLVLVYHVLHTRNRN